MNETLAHLKVEVSNGARRSFLIDSLNASTTYNCLVVVTVSNELIAVTDAVELTTPSVPMPKPPTDLTAKPSGDTSVLIQWQKPVVDELDDEITGYQVRNRAIHNT